VHVKEVPEINTYIDSSPPKRQQKNQSRVKHGPSKESKSQESRISRKNRKLPKTDYRERERDSTAYSSNISAKKTKVIHEEFYGYKNPETGKYSKHVKTEKFPLVKKSKEDGHLRAAKYYKFKNPKSGSELSSQDKDPYSSVNNWKLNENSPEKTVLISNVRQLSDSVDEASFYGPSILSGRMRSLTNAEILRDLTGI